MRSRTRETATEAELDLERMAKLGERLIQNHREVLIRPFQHLLNLTADVFLATYDQHPQATQVLKQGYAPFLVGFALIREEGNRERSDLEAMHEGTCVRGA